MCIFTSFIVFENNFAGDLDEKFKALETQVVEQFNVLKTMVLNIEDKLRHQDDQVKKQHRKIHSQITSLRQAR